LLVPNLKFRGNQFPPVPMVVALMNGGTRAEGEEKLGPSFSALPGRARNPIFKGGEDMSD